VNPTIAVHTHVLSPQVVHHRESDGTTYIVIAQKESSAVVLSFFNLPELRIFIEQLQSVVDE
jgi:hypothetical protein